MKPSAFRSNAVWWVLALACLIAFVLLIRALLDRTDWTAGESAAAETVLESPVVVSNEVLPEPAYQQPEMLDVPTQTVAWPADPSRPLPRQPTAAEIRESQRKADAAMKLLESDTPEILGTR